MIRLAGAILCAVAVAVAGCTVAVTPSSSAPAAHPAISAAPGQSSGPSTSQPAGSVPAATSVAPAAPEGLPRTWTRSEDLDLAIRGEPSVAASPDGGFVAVVSDARNVAAVLHSPDGQAWSEVAAPLDGRCGPTALCGATPTGIAANAETLVVTGQDEAMDVAAVWTSPDGGSWTRMRTLPDLRGGRLSGLVRTPSGFAAVVNGSPGTAPGSIGVVLGSADGGSWSVAWLPAPSGASDRLLNAVVGTGAGYAAVGSIGPAVAAWSSPDGRAWSATTMSGKADIGFGGGLVAHDGALWAFVPVDIWQPGVTNAFRWTSTDGGVTWAQGGSGPPFNLLRAVLSPLGGLVAIGRPAASQPGESSPIWTSVDGTAWTAATIGGAASRANDTVTSIAESNGRLVVAGWTDLDKGTSTGSDASSTGRLVFWLGDAATPPTLAAIPTPRPSETTALSSPSPGAASPSARPMPHQAPDAEALLPTTIGDTRYAIGSQLLPIEQDMAGGDMCFLFCPGEIGGFARKLGIPSGLASIAYAVPEGATGGPAAVIFAVRLPASGGSAPIADAKLEDAWVATHASPDPRYKQGAPLTLGGKHVRLVVNSSLTSDLNRYIYAHAGTLYLVGIYTSDSLQDVTKPGPVADRVFAALP